MKLLPLAFIPNTEGFQFIGFTRDYKQVSCVVKYKESVGHYVDEYKTLIGWRAKWTTI